MIDQRITVALTVQCCVGGMYGAVEAFSVGEAVASQMMRVTVDQDNIDVVETCGVFGRPLDGEVAAMNWSRALDEGDRLKGMSVLGAKEAVDVLKTGNEGGTALDWVRMRDGLARALADFADVRHFL